MSKWTRSPEHRAAIDAANAEAEFRAQYTEGFARAKELEARYVAEGRMRRAEVSDIADKPIPTPEQVADRILEHAAIKKLFQDKRP